LRLYIRVIRGPKTDQIPDSKITAHRMLCASANTLAEKRYPCGDSVDVVEEVVRFN
jgi:hypothetical protein